MVRTGLEGGEGVEFQITVQYLFSGSSAVVGCGASVWSRGVSAVRDAVLSSFPGLRSGGVGSHAWSVAASR